MFTLEPSLCPIRAISISPLLIRDAFVLILKPNPSDIPAPIAITFFNAPAGENLALNDLVYLSPGDTEGDTGRTAGSLYKTDPGNADTVLVVIRSKGIGFMTAAFTTGQVGEVQTGGT